MELDHIFIGTSKGAPEAELLKAFGLAEGSPNTHPGQGTANRRFFFHNAMLELLWIDNPEEAQSELAKPTRLLERCTLPHTDVSPFGICFRPNSQSEKKAPFPTWEYKPLYLPSSLVIEVGKDTPLSEPMWFYLAFASRPDSAVPEKRQAIAHEIGFKEITAATITVSNNQELSKPAIMAESLDHFFIRRDDSPLLELEFDQCGEGEIHDFRPSLPLVFKW